MATLDHHSIDSLFQRLTEFSPRHFQKQTIAAILSWQNILLRAPTGAGKTETAIAPFLFAKVLNIAEFPNKLIYIVPLRTLATSLRDRVERYVRTWEKHYPAKRPLAVTLQTGENPEDPRFEGDIVFCTIDQLLSSFLGIPYSVGRGSANVNAGVVFASYLVFDELHLLDPDRSFATTLELLKQVQGISPFLLMTATLTEELAAQLQQELRSRMPLRRQDTSGSLHLMNVTGEDLKAIETRQRYFEPITAPLRASAILEDIQTHQRKRAIVLCNTVAQAQGLFQDLRDLVKHQPIQISLLHSRFLPDDRKRKEEALKRIFGKDGYQQDDGNCHILISTQVIEAGIDITCEVMHTLLCPMNALLQRAGRCARFANQTGIVKVYRDVQTGEAFAELTSAEDDDEQLAQVEQRSKRKFLPYEDQVCEATWSVLQEHFESPMRSNLVGFEIEAAWVNQVHATGDQQQAKKRQDNRKAFDDQLQEAIFSGERSAAQHLIRHVDNRSIFMVEEQPMIDLDLPEVDLRGLEPFSLPRTTLLKVFREFQDSHPQDWIFKEIVHPEKSEGYSLPVARPIVNQGAITASIRLLVNPRYADYDDELGLQIGAEVEGNYLSQVKQNKSNSQEYRYRMDTYVGHLGRIWTCWNKPFPLKTPQYQSMRDEQLQAGGRFLRRKFFSNATQQQAEALFELLIFLAVITHDLGKLQRQWQSAMQGWQTIAHQYFKGSDPKGQLIAHTDYDPTDRALRDREGRTQKESLKTYEKQNPRPNHAIESAFLANEILEACLIPVLENLFEAEDEVINLFCNVVEMAAGRHHSAWTAGWDSVTLSRIRHDSTRRGELHLHEKANEAIAQSWQRLLGKDLAQILSLPADPPVLSQQVYAVEEIRLDCFNPDYMKYQQLYWLVVRGLRICDGRSVQI
ncbi:CRISPR-associated helicase Cas3' [Leptolyngbya sp. FACHB-711]|uniref:CRISPR-associated helicase Cas3' n=1 Tax=Leptolyngbya sp. FACHB-711 TaxID=2692813 RepID=UPI0016893A51|nr:CRISPR-associated helicase Cas3' [Leptolyngbya sp. FACHB-711]MBD2027009.1 CRISPR-associated helicase Cas3' [Leptolyngbya sp. FACHB-711]